MTPPSPHKQATHRHVGVLRARGGEEGRLGNHVPPLDRPAPKLPVFFAAQSCVVRLGPLLLRARWGQPACLPVLSLGEPAIGLLALLVHDLERKKKKGKRTISKEKEKGGENVGSWYYFLYRGVVYFNFCVYKDYRFYFLENRKYELILS